jgi:pimeloyl-ACP methyl ester carboxylesterase
MNDYNWLDTTEYPFAHHYFAVNGHKLHYIDEGSGPALLFVHGTPSWSFDFRNAIKILSKRFRCVAVDHIGFGLSDKPADYDYSTQGHSQTLERFIVEKNLEEITLVVHDFGGPIGLAAAMRIPERVSRIVALNTWLWSSAADPDFIRFSKILKSPLLPFLYLHLNFSPRFLLPQSFGEKKISRKTLAQYTRPFPNSARRRGPLAFARSLLHDQAWFEELWNQRAAIQDKPALFIWGMKDQFVKPHYLEKFLAGFPNAQAYKFETCGHFPQEEEPERVADLIGGFIIPPSAGK